MVLRSGGDSAEGYRATFHESPRAHQFFQQLNPLLSGQSQQRRLPIYRLWPEFHVSSLGQNWRQRVRGWSDEARADFVSETLHRRFDPEIAALAVEDNSVDLKKAAADALMWTGSDDALVRVLRTMDAQTFAEFARKDGDRIPPVLRSEVVTAMQDFVKSSTDQPARLRTALDLKV